LKFKFRKLHQTVVNNVNDASIMDFLFQEAVIGLDDMRRLVGWLSLTTFSAQTGCVTPRKSYNLLKVSTSDR